MVIGEGAGVLAVEELEHARRRGASIYAEVVGIGSAFNRRGQTTGLARAAQAAMKQAGIGADDLDHINAHGLGTVQRRRQGSTRPARNCRRRPAAGAAVGRQELFRQPRRRQRHDRTGGQLARPEARHRARQA